MENNSLKRQFNDEDSDSSQNDDTNNDISNINFNWNNLHKIDDDTRKAINEIILSTEDESEDYEQEIDDDEQDKEDEEIEFNVIYNNIQMEQPNKIEKTMKGSDVIKVKIGDVHPSISGTIVTYLICCDYKKNITNIMLYNIYKHIFLTNEKIDLVSIHNIRQIVEAKFQNRNIDVESESFNKLIKLIKELLPLKESLKAVLDFDFFIPLNSHFYSKYYSTKEYDLEKFQWDKIKPINNFYSCKCGSIHLARLDLGSIENAKLFTQFLNSCDYINIDPRFIGPGCSIELKVGAIFKSIASLKKLIKIGYQLRFHNDLAITPNVYKFKENQIIFMALHISNLLTRDESKVSIKERISTLNISNENLESWGKMISKLRIPICIKNSTRNEMLQFLATFIEAKVSYKKTSVGFRLRFNPLQSDLKSDLLDIFSKCNIGVSISKEYILVCLNLKKLHPYFSPNIWRGLEDCHEKYRNFTSYTEIEEGTEIGLVSVAVNKHH